MLLRSPKIFIICSLVLVAVAGFLSVDSASNKIKDEFNRLRVMHGLNVVYK